MKREMTCPCCGTKFEGDFYDECPQCCWVCDGFLWDEKDLFDDDLIGPNPLPLGKAQELYAQGKDIYGDPIKKINKNGRKYHKNTVRQVTIKTACRNFPKIAIEENNFRSVVKLCKSATENATLGNTNFNGQTTICNNGKTRSINIKNTAQSTC